MAAEPHALIEEDQDILIFTLNRPEKYNALSNALMTSLKEQVWRFRDTGRFKVMLIRARGPYFSAGADLREGERGFARPETGTAIREFHRLGSRDMRLIYDEMEHIEKPFVVAHQGTVVGGGLEMSLSCDFRLASEDARYSLPEGRFGILPATNGVSRLVRIVGPHWARYLVMAGIIADAQKALAMGLVHELWPADGFEERCLEFCRHLAGQSAEQMGTAKIAIELASDLGRSQAGAVERLANSALMIGPAYRQAIEAHIAGIGGKR